MGRKITSDRAEWPKAFHSRWSTNLTAKSTLGTDSFFLHLHQSGAFID